MTCMLLVDITLYSFPISFMSHSFISTEKKLYCIYVAIGQKRSTVAQIVKRLTDSGKTVLADCIWWASIGVPIPF